MTFTHKNQIQPNLQTLLVHQNPPNYQNPPNQYPPINPPIQKVHSNKIFNADSIKNQKDQSIKSLGNSQTYQNYGLNAPLNKNQIKNQSFYQDTEKSVKNYYGVKW